MPNKLIATANDIADDDEALIGHLFTVARELAKREGIAEDGYRLIINCNSHGGQEVYHLHLHLLGGKPLGPMLASPPLMATRPSAKKAVAKSRLKELYPHLSLLQERLPACERAA